MGSGDYAHLGGTVDAVVMDPLLRQRDVCGAERLFLCVAQAHRRPALSRAHGLLTDKENEAVAPPYTRQEGREDLAGLDYQQKMAEIFGMSTRSQDDGVMTLMFTHKATGAWDALTKGLIDAGFAITASGRSIGEAAHIKDKSFPTTDLSGCVPPCAETEDGVDKNLEPR